MATVKLRPGLPVMTLDPSSTAVGAALYHQGILLDKAVFRAKGNDYGRLLDIARQFHAWVVKWQQLWADGVEVWVEEPFYSPKRSHDTPIKMVHGMLLYAASSIIPRPVLQWNYVGLNTWRSKIVSGKPDKSKVKQQVMDFTSKYFHTEVTDDNIGDALGILYWRLRGRRSV